MREAVETIKDLICCIESAIHAGDWIVDGACEPTAALVRAKQFIKEQESKNCKNCVIDKPCTCKGKDFAPCGFFISKMEKESS